MTSTLRDCPIYRHVQKRPYSSERTRPKLTFIKNRKLTGSHRHLNSRAAMCGGLNDTWQKLQLPEPQRA